MEEEDAVDQLLRARWASGNIDIDRYNFVHSLHHCIIVEVTAYSGACAHRNHPVRCRHLVIELTDNWCHFTRNATCDNHQIRLARAGSVQLHTEARQVVVGSLRRHHLNGATSETKEQRPCRSGACPVDALFKSSSQNTHIADLRSHAHFLT